MTEEPDEPDIMAAEYVLGTLDPALAAAIAARAAHDAALAACIARWEERLAPLAALAAPATPPPGLWDRLAASVAQMPPATSLPAKAPFWESVGFWRATTVAAMAVAAIFIGIVVLREPASRSATRPVAALVPANGTPAAFVAEVQNDGTLKLIPLEPVTVADGDDLELWSLPPGASRPVSLGVIPATGRETAPPHAPPGTGGQLLVSLEPRGGSPTGLPTGPVLFAGTLRGGTPD